MTREEYLLAATEELRPLFISAKLELQPLKVSCGFPSKSITKTLGECWKSQATLDGTRQIFISPLLDDDIKVVGVLTHELIHASLPDTAKHGPQFKAAMKALGLEGKAIHALPGADLNKRIAAIVERLGPYPNPVLHLVPEERKERKKSAFNLFCPKHLDYIVKVPLKTLNFAENFNGPFIYPSCPCGEEMLMTEEDYVIFTSAR